MIKKPIELLTVTDGDTPREESYVIVNGDIIPITLSREVEEGDVILALDAPAIWSESKDKEFPDGGLIKSHTSLGVFSTWMKYGDRNIRYLVELNFTSKNVDENETTYKSVSFFVENIFDLAGLVETLKVLV